MATMQKSRAPRRSSRGRLGGGLLAMMALLLAGCGDGGGNGTPTDPESPETPELPGGGGPSGGALSDDARFAAIRAVEQKAAELRRQGLSRDAFNASLAAYAEGRSEFDAAGVDELSSVWAVFRDGRVLIIANNRDPVPESASVRWVPSPEAAARQARMAMASIEPTELPGPGQARLLHSLGPGFTGQAPIDDLSGWLRDANYTVVAGGEGDARIETLRNVRGDGFFYFNTHGAKGKTASGEEVYVMGTSSIAAPEKDRFPDFRDDLDNGRLIYLTALNGERSPAGEALWDTRYAITHHFVRQYMSFGENSIAFLNVCGSAFPSPTVDAFRGAMHAKGVGVYVGWTHTINSDPAFRGVRYFVDRLLGANEYMPESPEQRPFAWPEVLEEMRKEGLAKDPASGAELNVSTAAQSGPGAGLLAPSIRNLVADQWNDELLVYGIFGEDPGGDGKVTIDDGSGPVGLSVIEWKPTEIRVGLPVSGAGSHGDVVVTVRSHESNARRLMSWTGTLTYTARDAGTLQHSLEMEMDIRLDPADIRMKPGEKPAPPPIQPWISSAKKSATAQFGATGEYRKVSGDCVYTHRYSGSRPLGYPTAATGYGFTLALGVELAKKEAAIFLPVAAPYTHTRITQCDGSSNTDVTTSDFGVARAIFAADGFLRAPVDDALNLLPLRREVQIQSRVGAPAATATIEWGRIDAAMPFEADGIY